MKTLFICANPISKTLQVFLVSMLSLLLGIGCFADVSLEVEPLELTKYELNVNFDIDECDGIYEQYLNISIDDPDIVLSKIDCSIEPTLQYASAFKSSKSLFIGPCIFSGIIDVPSADRLETAYVYVTYRLLFEKHSKTIALPLGNALLAQVAPEVQNSIDIPQTISKMPAEKTKKTDYYPVTPTIARHSLPSRKAWISDGWEQIVPPLIPLGTLSFLCMLIGLILLFKGSYAQRLAWRPIAAILGMALIACSIVVAAKAYQAQYKDSHKTY